MALMIFVFIFEVTIPVVLFIMVAFTSVSVLNALISIPQLKRSFENTVLRLRQKLRLLQSKKDLDDTHEDKRKLILTSLELYVLHRTKNNFIINEQNYETFIDLIRGEGDKNSVKIVKPTKKTIFARLSRSAGNLGVLRMGDDSDKESRATNSTTANGLEMISPIHNTIRSKENHMIDSDDEEEQIVDEEKGVTKQRKFKKASMELPKQK